MFPLELEIKEDGTTYIFTIYDCGTLDYGLMVEDSDRNTLFDCPNYLSSHYYGYKSNGEKWTKEQWLFYIQDESHVFIQMIKRITT